MKNFLKNYAFILCMLVGIVAGCITGAVWPGATALEPLGTVFINLMFCIVVPMVFCSIASAIANMDNAKKAGKIMGTTVATFLVTAGIAALIMYIVCRVFPWSRASTRQLPVRLARPWALPIWSSTSSPSPTLLNCGAAEPSCP